MTNAEPKPSSFNDWADFWRKDIGANVIPFDTLNCQPLVEWRGWQDQPIPEELHREWKQRGMFEKGLAVILGTVWHRPDRRGLYLVGIDIDNAKGIQEICTRNGKTITLQRLAESTLVEQHEDRPDRGHVYVYSRHPYAKKSSDVTSPELAAKLHVNELPAIEVKGRGEHGLMFCTPSINKNGRPHKIIGTKEPVITDELEQHIDEIFRKYAIKYLDVKNSAFNGKSKIPMADLFDAGARIFEGHNRHEALLRVMESLLKRNRAILSDEKIRRLAEEWNLEHCVPPLAPDEVDRQWIDARKFLAMLAPMRKLTPRDHQSESRMSEVESVKLELNEEQSKGTPVVSKAQEAFELVEELCIEFFADEHGQPYAAIKIGDHYEVLPMSGSRFKHWLAMIYHDRTGNLLNEADISNVLQVAKGHALFKGKQQRLELRLAVVFDEGTDRPVTIYYDLIDPNWQCIKITAQGWTKEQCPLLFRRYNLNKAQVEPSRNYPEDIFDQFMRLTNVVRSDWLLVKCYVISLFMSDMAKAVLMPYGEKGSAKSTLMRLIKSMVDPSSVEFLSIPHDRNQLVQNLSHNYIGYYDNVSYIVGWLSDEFCKAVTGSGLAKRALYTDDDDIVYSFRRALGFNGISLAATRPDLLDRGISIRLQRIPKNLRKGDKQLEAEFERIRPQLLGYIMDTLVKVLQRWGTVKLAEYPRMADFAQFCELAAQCMGYKANEFTAAYAQNIERHTKEAIVASPVASAIVKMMEDRERFEGTVSDLMVELEPIAAKMRWDLRSKQWPSTPQALGRRLNESMTDLREVGIIIERPEDKQANVSRVVITKSDGSAESADCPPHASPPTERIRVREQPPMNKSIPCPYCTCSFPSPADALNHSLSRHPRQPFVADMTKLGYDFALD